MQKQLLKWTPLRKRVARKCHSSYLSPIKNKTNKKKSEEKSYELFLRVFNNLPYKKQ